LNMVSDSEDFEDKIYIALSHKLRRDIIKLLAERKKMAFSELMKELGVDDTGTLTFHLRKLVGLITKISSGEYTLTNLGKKAYDIMMNMERVETLEQHNIEQKDFYIASKVKEVKPREELKPDLIFVVDRINFVIDKQLLEHTKSQGKKLLVNDVITLEIAEDIDPQLFKETVDSISDIIMIKVPKHLRSIVELKSRDVLTIKEIDVGSRTLSSIPSTIISIGNIVSVIAEAVSSAIKFSATKFTKNIAKTLIYENVFSNIFSIECEIRGGKVKIFQWDGDEAKITIYRYGEGISRCNYDVDVKGSIMEVEVDGCEAEIALPKENISSLTIDAKGGYIEIEQKTTLNKFELGMKGGFTSAKLYNQKNLVFEALLRGGALNIILGYEDFEGVSCIGFELMGGYINANIAVPPNTKVTPSAQNFGGLLRINIDDDLKKLKESKRVIELESKVTGGFCDLRIRKTS